MEVNKKKTIAYMFFAFVLLGIPEQVLFTSKSAVGTEGYIQFIFYGVIFLVSILSVLLLKTGGDRAILIISTIVLGVTLFLSSLKFGTGLFITMVVLVAIAYAVVQYIIIFKVLEKLDPKSLSWIFGIGGVGVAAGRLLFSEKKLSLLMYIATIALAIVISVIYIIASNKGIENSTATLKEEFASGDKDRPMSSVGEVLKQYGVAQILICCFIACGIVSLLVIHGETYFVEARGYSADEANSWITIFLMLVFGMRLITGFFSDKIPSVRIVQFGQIVAILGVMVLLIPSIDINAKLAIFLIGGGLSTVLPNLLWQNKVMFKRGDIPLMLGLELAVGALGALLIPLLFGIIAVSSSYEWMPFYMLVLMVLLTILCEYITTKRVKNLENTAVVEALTDQYVLIGIVGSKNKMFRFVKDDFALLSNGIDNYDALVDTLGSMIGDEVKKADFKHRFSMKELKGLRKAGVRNIEEEICLDIAGEEFWLEFMVHVSEEREIDYTFMLKNIQEIHKYQQMGMMDYATGLLNKNSYLETLDRTGDENAEDVVCVYIDINDLHEINNKYGHSAGDNMIIAVSSYLKQCFKDDKCFRIGGDEFVVLSKMPKDEVDDIMIQLCAILKERHASISYGCVKGSATLDIAAITRIADDMMLTEKENYRRSQIYGYDD